VVDIDIEGLCFFLWSPSIDACCVVLCCTVLLPQAVLVPAAVSGLAHDMYMGIVHTEVDRKYENFFYQMEVCIKATRWRGLLVEGQGKSGGGGGGTLMWTWTASMKATCIKWR
jgi:hypothetical protein